jgi:methionine-rich copper-binding protein CopC
MKTPTLTVYHHAAKTFIVCLIISMMIMSPLAPLASAAPSFSRRAEVAHTIDPTAPAVPSISATKTDSFPDVDADGKAVPGEMITYDVNITNGGTDATGVNFADTIDPNTTLVGGSLKVSPLAYADTYSAAKDTQLVVGAPGVLTNDTGLPAPTAVAIAGGATAQGGTVTLNADGSFTYNPPASFAGADTFTYTATNGLTPNDTAQVTINVDAAPSVASTTPTNSATNQALNTNISITFSEPVDVTGNWFQISCTTSGTRDVADTVVTGGPTTFTINPNADFTSSETCTVTVFAAQISDQDTNDPPDNMAANFVFSFATIDAAPTVTSTTPTNGAINQTTNTDVSVTFSEPVNVTGNWFQIVCGTSGTRNVADTVVTGGPTTFTINPNSDFAAGETCTATVFAAQVTDQDANDPPDNMAANFVFSFTMDAAPTVNATTPTNGATQVANNTNVSITFSEPVDVTGNWFQIVGATSGTRNVADTVVTGGPTTFTVNPNADFTNGELVTVTVFAAQVSDQDTNDPPQNMAANFVFSFTIDLPPSVTTTVPTNGAIDVLKSSNIVINFSENVTVTTSSFTIECPSPGNLQTFVVSGSGTNQITLNPNSDLPPGVICTVTAIANQISDTDAGDPPDNMDANFVFSFGVKPEAVDDARNATGNIRIQTAGNSNFTVLTNDIGPGITVTTADTTSLRGGNVAVAANGTFTYNPQAGYEGSDSFNYTISNAAGSDVGTVNITITGMIWFVNSSSGACTTINGSCGRLTNPFSTLAAFEAANGNATPIVNGDVTSPEAGDHLFIYTGVGNYTGPLTLENNQRVIGQGATSSLQTLSGITPATDSDTLPSTGGTKPSITTVATSGQNGINLASGNQLYGLAFSNTDAAAIRGAVNVGTGIMSDIVINNTGGGGVILTNGGTVTISGINTIVTTTGTALNVSNTTIGASGLTFQSISSSGGSNTGIILDTTGASGGLTVNGDGTNTSVGGNSSGGTIANKSGADGSTSTGIGIYLNSTASVVLRRMTINGTNQNFGVRGTSVNGFTLEFSTVTGTNGTDVALDEGSVNFDNLTGAAAITSCVIDGGLEDNLNVVNTSGTLNRLTISGTTFGFNSTVNGNNNILIESQNAGTTLNFTLKSSLIKGARADWINFSANSSSAMDAVIGGPLLADGNTFDNLGANAHPGAAAGGNRVVSGAVGTQTVDIRNNTLKGSKGEAIRVRSTATGAVTGTVNARVRNNTIGVAGTANSGSSESFGIFAFGDGGSDMTIAITNNSVFQYNNHGINLQFGDEINNGSVFNATVTGNTVSNPGNINTDFNGISLNNGTVGATDDFTSCVDIGGAGVGNIVTGSSSGAIFPNNANIRLRQRQSTTVRLPGYVGPVRDNGDNEVAEVDTYLAGRNTLTTSAANSVSTGGGFIGGAACTQPSFALLKPVTNQREHFARTTNPQPTSQTVSHHAKIAKRESVTSLGSSVGNAAVGSSSVVKEPSGRLINAMQDKKPRRGISVKPTVAPLSGETVTHSIGTLLAGKTVHIQFQVTVNTPYGGGAFVSNQGTVSGSNFADVLTDDPAVGGANDPTQTPILLTPNVSVTDAQANEPASASAPMLFTVALSAPAGPSGASVHYATADQAPAVGHAVAGIDYTAVPDTVLNFATGEQFKTISVDVLADGVAGEPDETFELNLSNPTNAVIVDGQAIGTIKQGNAAGAFLISELRTSGPGGAGDDFVELYNNADTPLTVAASDASGGYGLFKMGADCGATPVLIGTIPNGTVIPARGHYLFVGSAYSLANYGGTGDAAGNQTLSSDIESDRNVAIFNTATVTNLSSVTRLDAVGFGSNTGGNCDLLREGTTLTPLSGSALEYSWVRDECGKKGNPAIFGPCPTGGLVKDSNNNADDFIFVDTSAAVTVAGQRLGAPGPQNLASPLPRTTIAVLLLDSNIGAPAQPNRVRDLTPAPPNATNGTLSIRRRFVNNTGAPVTRLRFRIVDISSISVPGGIADIRALTSGSVVVSGITDAATCLASNGVATTPCTVTVQGTTLEQPPTQTMGGALNTTLSAGTITLGTPLAPGASINLQFLLGVQQTGSFKFFFNIEALP